MRSAIALVSSAFEDTSLDEIVAACRKWAETASLDLLVHDAGRSVEFLEDAAKCGVPVVLHLPREFRREGRGAMLASNSVRVFEHYVPEPWLVESFGERLVIHGRGLSGFKWALRAAGRRACGTEVVISYGRHPSQVGWLKYPPEGRLAKNRPAVVLIHGGFWGDCVSVDHMLAPADLLAERGFISLNMEFRRGERFDWAQGARDVYAAIDYLGRFADKAGVDPTRIAVIGHSSGAHLAHAALALYGDVLLARGLVVKAFVSLAGILDTEAACILNLGNGAAQAVLQGVGHYGVTLSNPVHQKINCPTLAVHGDNDVVVPITLSRSFVNNSDLVQSARRVLFEVPGCDHMNLLKSEFPHWIHVLSWLSTHV